MRISDWSSDVCSSDLALSATFLRGPEPVLVGDADAAHHLLIADRHTALTDVGLDALPGGGGQAAGFLVTNTARFSSGHNRCTKRMLAAPFHSGGECEQFLFGDPTVRSEEHTSELQSLMR